LNVHRRALAAVVGTVALTVVCAIAAIAVNLSILHRTPPDPIGRLPRQLHHATTSRP
jgi:hypothetical protein